MTPKQYAKSRQITLKQFNNLSKLVLGGVASDSLDEEQIAKLDAALAAAAEQVNQLPPASDNALEENKPTQEAQAKATPETSSLTASKSNQIETSKSNNNQVIEILGEDLLRRNMAIFMTHHVRSLQRIAESHKAILGKFEQEVYNDTAETFARMTRNMAESFSDINKITNPQTEEDKQLYKDYVLLVEEFLLPEEQDPKT